MDKKDNFVAEKLYNDDNFTFIKQLSEDHNSEANENLTSNKPLGEGESISDFNSTKPLSEDDNFDADDELTFNEPMGEDKNIDDSTFTKSLSKGDNHDADLTCTKPLSKDENSEAEEDLTFNKPMVENEYKGFLLEDDLNGEDDYKANDDLSEYHMECIHDKPTPFTELCPGETECCKLRPIIST